ncbi:hypothetical protein AAFF_G00392480 [Aldrovandia affinis]|uniref:VWFC domain-containing protein n=1 Tax=Aldrovandia affinis TaxID=143900 RepID=A0AAD7SE92_9TELE|nr:hypothetical protein AAFF_G00392480 [Aldrovandia affinis]
MMELDASQTNQEYICVEGEEETSLVMIITEKHIRVTLLCVAYGNESYGKKLHTFCCVSSSTPPGKTSKMKPGVIFAVSVLLHLGFSLAQVGVGRMKRRRGGQRLGRNRSMRQQNSDTFDRLRSVPVNNGDDGMPVFIEYHKSVDERESNYNVILGKKGQCAYQGMTMFHKAVWSPKPCLTCQCFNGVVACDEFICPQLHCLRTVTPAGECCPVCNDLVPDIPEISGDFSEPNDPSDQNLAGPHTQEEIDELLRKEEQAHREEEERLRKTDVERRRKRKQKRLQAEKQRQLFEQRRREEEELREKMEKEEEEKRQEERRLAEEAAAERAKQLWAEERRLEEDRRRSLEMEQRELEEEMEDILEEMEEEWEREEEREGEEEMMEREGEEEEEIWLRGDVFQMPPRRTTSEGTPPLPAPEVVDSLRPNYSLPPGCIISDVTITCENAQFTNIPPLSIPELKALSLEGNDITTIPAGAFNGIPNLEWINLGKNKITSSGIHPQVFKSLKFLTRLYLDGNLLEQVPTELPSSLQELKINENNLRGIDENSLQVLQNLITLELEGNMLSEGNVDPLAFLPLTQLSYLRLGRNYFRTIPQGLPQSLQELYLENNVIEEISDTAFNNTRDLNIIVLRHNRLDEARIAPLAWFNHKHLESIDLSHNKLYHVPSFLPRSLVHLILVGNQIERIPGYVFAHMEPGIEYLYLSFNKLDSEGIDPVSFFGSFHSIIELFLDHNQLTTVPLAMSEMKSLHFLRLNDNKIRNFADEAICDPLSEEDSNLMTLRLENNFIDTRKISPTAFSCIRSYSSVVLKPQKT